MRRFAIRSPRSICFASWTSSAAFSSLWRPTSARKSCRLSAAPRGDRGDDGRLRLLLLLGLLGVLLLAGARLPDLQAERLQLAGELLRLLVVQVVLEHERLELGGLDEPALLRALDERLDLFRLNQFDQLILRQRETSVLSGGSSRGSYKLTHLKLFFLRLPRVPNPEACYKLKRGALFVYSGEGLNRFSRD